MCIRDRYEANPQYDGQSVLGLISDGNITYGIEMPDKVEVNAAMVSINGGVLFDHVKMVDNGAGAYLDVAADQITGGSLVKESFRRLGGVVCSTRPATTVINWDGSVLAGFKSGQSIMDENLSLKQGGLQPPFIFQEERPTWTMVSVGTVYGAK